MHFTRSRGMSRIIAVLMAIVFTASVFGAPVVFAQATKDKPTDKAATKADTKPNKKEPIDINSASAEELQSIKGIGDVYAKKIIEGRPYKGKDELVQRNIIPKATYDKIKGQIIAKQK
jgi:competence protein ComEA